MANIDIYENIDLILDQGAAMISHYRSDPVLAAYDLLRVDLAPIQRVILRDMWFKSFTITVMGRGGGKTFLLGVNAALHALLYPGYRIGLIAPSFRQSKMIFAEVEKLYNRSPILREAVEKKPTRGADTCFLKFKSTDYSNGSYIEALPIGVDGAKIRGSRFYLVQIDELAQMPPDIIDMVIRPMAAVSLEPMQRVREKERQQRLIELGLATEDDFEETTANKMIMTSSGYFKFNHMWNRMKSYWKAIKEEPEGHKKYAVHQVPYKLLPKGFMDEENIRVAKRDMSTIEFMMEYEAAMVSDSDGFFKASMLEACTLGSSFPMRLNGESGKEYVMGVDPNQGGAAACGIVIIEVGNPHKIVYVQELKKKTTQEMVIEIQKLSDNFNLKRIYMDSQGGGNAIKDLLQEGYNKHEPILDVEDETNLSKPGRRILQLVNPTSNWISDANFDALALFEHKDLRFPMPHTSSLAADKLYDDVKLLKSQLTNIIVTQTARGIRHFDTPRKGQNKDLYSALILSAWGVRELFRASQEPEKRVHHQGLVRQHRAGAKFAPVASVSGKDYLGQATLKK
jgi:hypothetical protein